MGLMMRINGTPAPLFSSPSKHTYNFACVSPPPPPKHKTAPGAPILKFPHKILTDFTHGLTLSAQHFLTTTKRTNFVTVTFFQMCMCLTTFLKRNEFQTAAWGSPVVHQGACLLGEGTRGTAAPCEQVTTEGALGSVTRCSV